jgi:UDP-glucose 4-epimerase
MNIKLIGGNGFIGSEVYHFLKRDHNVQIIDIASNIGDLPYESCDVITEKNKLNFLLKNTDIVYMFSAISEATKNHEDPITAVNTNILGLAHVLDACVKNNVKRVVFSSTTWVYSECEENNVAESTQLNLQVGTSIYAASKICGEVLVRSYCRSYNLDYTICRYGTIYGENANPRTIVSTFIRNAKSNLPLNITSNGFRNFIHVKDLAKILSNIPNFIKETKNETINIDGEERVSLVELAECIINNVQDLKVNYQDVNNIEYRGKEVSTKKLKDIFNYKQKINLKDWIRSQLNV